MSNVEIFFDAPSHKYTDNKGNVYTSVTTLIGKYGIKFDTFKMAKACEAAGKRGNPKYAGKSALDLIQLWERQTKEAITIGNDKHDYLETSIKASNNFKIFKQTVKSGRMYTISDIIYNPGYGNVDLDYFISLGVRQKYPAIFDIIRAAAEEGYRMYPEVVVYSSEFLVSGLIDLFLIKDKSFLIVDWKTNRDKLTFESGYYEKDRKGFVTDNFIKTNDYFKHPLQALAYSKGNTYSLQLSLYRYLSECFELDGKGNILCHIRHADANGIEKVDIHQMPYFKREVVGMLSHFKSNNKVKVKSNLFD